MQILLELRIGQGECCLIFQNLKGNTSWVWGKYKPCQPGIEDMLLANQRFKIRVNGFHYAGQ